MIRNIYSAQLLDVIRECVIFFSENGPTEEGDYTSYYSSKWSELYDMLESCFARELE